MNVKYIKIIIPNDMILKKINTTPTLNRLSRLKLQIGENMEYVNHKQYSDMLRLYTLIGVSIEDNTHIK